MQHDSSPGGSGRQPPIKEVDGRRVLDLERYAPFWLVTVTNAITRGGSNVFLRELGIGIIDVRVITTVAVEPGCPAVRICELVNLDKGAVSRSLAFLESRGYLAGEPAPTDPRRKFWRLSEAGQALHDKVLDLAIKREAALVAGIGEDDLAHFQRIMARMLANIAREDGG
ncbi:transcriptional regulatory protein [Oceanicola granulosus HTCC2516]|uniref:Transcriptional regulatory protein n=1 Tax=Oceanicola granulosus (strain ATCC BAA-861 / DSM 15982 / KCTC 12143 / HTCC2516) TaxID=314256 RepID=Q2CC84_OCEGH|nr:MarR family winged helix-turn-helix transcriptional regulator [Oceanicola granulosus]EAR50276.1 transcriptional regulatory protein [Oceanicola granulosus HTCC2516]